MQILQMVSIQKILVSDFTRVGHVIMRFDRKLGLYRSILDEVLVFLDPRLAN